jgi:endonuclease III
MKPVKRIKTLNVKPPVTDLNRAAKILSVLKKEYPEVKCALNFNSPFQLLVATILSAQCTDERVNIVTADLFKSTRCRRIL